MGQTASTKLYQAGVDSAQGLLKGLESKQSALNKKAADLGRKLVQAMKKELKIKSPSQVAAGIGINVGLGLAGGLASQVGDVFRQSLALADAALPSIGTEYNGDC